ncbi:vicilin-like seed storage protein At2g18540 [Helianthus annuus]|uniref:vicilin-like seed storage protein At2g18540 n=1 Tax=Helianthus annuus TaxID=4232 RepID=UPI001653089D|nr:vicilin-like seed storage protein At2g18540 [Helianthus annuus]
MSINAAKQQMSFLASVLELYEGLVSGKIGNSELTKEDYDQIDPVEMELIDIRQCLASCIRRAQRYVEITGKQSISGPSTKLGYDKSKVTYFRCKQKGHFKRECKNSEVDETEKPCNDDYYRKAIYHRSKEEPKMIENNPKEKSRAYTVTHDDEGYDWGQILPEEDRIDNQVTAHGRTTSKGKHHVFVAEIKEKTREEILREKTERERFIVGCRMEKMRDIVHDDDVLVIPLSVEYYSNTAKDKTYPKRRDKIIRHAMTSSLRKRDEERMKKNVENLVDDLKKAAEEVKVKFVKEDVKIEEEEKVIKEVVEEKTVTEEQQFDEKKKEEEEVKNESLVAGDDGDEAVGEEEQKKKDADQTKTANTKVLKTTECQPEECRSSLAQEEKVAELCVG